MITAAYTVYPHFNRQCYSTGWLCGYTAYHGILIIHISDVKINFKHGRISVHHFSWNVLLNLANKACTHVAAPQAVIVIILEVFFRAHVVFIFMHDGHVFHELDFIV